MPDDITHGTRRTILRTVAAGAVTGLGGTAVATAPGRSSRANEREVLVGVSAGADLVGSVEPALPDGARVVGRNGTLRFVRVRLPAADDAEMQQFVATVRRRPGVKYAEPNATHRALLTPNDPEYGGQYVPTTVGVPTAWDATLGSSSVTVAVVDQGIQYDHPDLDGNVCTPKGRDVVDGDPDPYPADLTGEYHATAVAGPIAAETDNGTAIAGLSDSCLLSVRVLDETGAGSIADIATGVQWAADNGADVVNLSLGGGGFTATLKNAVSYALNNGALPIAAAGNAAGSGVAYPAAYSECVAVSATDGNGTLAPYSSYGPAIELAAPGSNVLTTTTTPRGGTDYLTGTSFATAVVSGCAALAASQWGGLSPAGLRDHLTGTATPLGLPATYQGCGRVDAAGAVGVDPANRVTNCASGGGCGSRSTTTTISDWLGGSGATDCWSYGWNLSGTCEVVLELDGPGNADFDLYVGEGTTTCPGPGNYDHVSKSPDSQETITVAGPDTSTPLQVAVVSYYGPGSYDLTITEKST